MGGSSIKIMIKITTILIVLIFVFIPFECTIHQLERIHEAVKVDEVIPDIVTVTTYSVTEAETDSTPLITASGFKLNATNPKRHRIIAVSRDLKRKYKFGQKVRIEGAGKYNGIYTIRDLMHHRWKNKIDILINPSDKHTKLRRIKMYRIEKKNKLG
jgi:3D (Asp-Asp-Asp) domain-containing protein